MGIEVEIYEEGLEDHPRSSMIMGNLIMALWIALGAIASRFINPLMGWAYLIFAIAMVGFVLRKLVCANCYYYNKWCPLGWGKLAGVFFKKGDIEKFGTSSGIKFAPAVYGFLSLMPLILIIISLFQEFLISKVIVLILLLGVSLYSGTIARKKGCMKCKMKLICPGCAVK